jgi:hypothetical protein
VTPELTRLLETIEELGEAQELLLMEPRERYDAAIVGVVERFNDTFVLYDREAVLRILEEDMEEEEALEHYYFNVVGGWLGPGTPAFLVAGTLVPAPERPSVFSE